MRLANQEASLPVLKERRTRNTQQILHLLTAKAICQQLASGSYREWGVVITPAKTPLEAALSVQTAQKLLAQANLGVALRNRRTLQRVSVRQSH